MKLIDCRAREERRSTLPQFQSLAYIAVHGPWRLAHIEENISDVPNLTSRRQDPALVALGEALRRIRQAQSISQEHLALLAEVDRSYVGRVERGDNNVALLTLVRLAGALNITVAVLMEQAGL